MVIPRQLLLMLLLLFVRRALVAAVVVVVCLVSPRFLDRCALLDARIMALPLEFGVRWEGQDPSHCLAAKRVSQGKTMGRRRDVPNLEDPLPVRTSPDAEDVLAVPDAKDGSADLLAGLAELVANHGEQQVLPVAVGHALSQAHHPLAAVLVLLVLPYWTDPLLEEVVVRHQRQRRRALQVLVDGEEVLDRLDRGDGVEGLFVLDKPVRLGDGRAEPEDPAVAQRVG